MKFGKYVDEQARPDWRDKYLDYSQLKRHIKDAVAQLESGSDESAFSPRTTSLSVMKKASESPESSFYNKLEEEVLSVPWAAGLGSHCAVTTHNFRRAVGQEDLQLH